MAFLKTHAFRLVTVGLWLALLAFYVFRTTGGGWLYYDYTPGKSHLENVNRFDYAQLAEAFRAGHLSLALQPSESLAKVANPYDMASRGNAVFPWDVSLYGGHYYLYFTPVPVLLAYLPYHALTGRYPSPPGLVCLLLAAALVCNTLTVARFHGAYFRTHLWQWGLLIASLGAGAAALFRPDQMTWYLIAIVTGFAAASAYMFGCALLLTSRPTYRKAILTALALVLAVSCRPLLACLAPLALLAYVGQVRRGRAPWRQAAAGLVVVLLGASAIAVYNYERFDDPFEFGLSYQLSTKSNLAFPLGTSNPLVLFNRVRTALPLILFKEPRVLLGPPRLDRVGTPAISILPTGDWLMDDPPDALVGLVPFCPLALLLLLASSRAIRRQAGAWGASAFALGLLACGCMIVFVMADVGSVASRYLFDFVGPMLLAAHLMTFAWPKLKAEAARWRLLASGWAVLVVATLVADYLLL